MLAGAALSTATVIVLRNATAPQLLFAALTVCAAAYVAFAVYRTLTPLVTPGSGENTIMIAGRTRAALERDKALTLRAIKELEFDYAMGKVADGDFAEIRDRLRLRALRLIRHLDGAAAYRVQIERDLAERLPAGPAATDARPTSSQPPAPTHACGGCGTVNDADARFCKMCGHALLRQG
jgi:hypothetical protein